MVFKPVAVKALSGFRLWLKYADGVEGEVDLSHLAGRGVFRIWRDQAVFETVRIGENGALQWGDKVDLCPDALYLRLTGKAPEEVFPKLKAAEVDA